MPLKNMLRKIFLCIALGGHPVFGIGMSHEKIEELLHAMHQTSVEMTISDDEPIDTDFPTTTTCPTNSPTT
jgi:hypothetical protein